MAFFPCVGLVFALSIIFIFQLCLGNGKKNIILVLTDDQDSLSSIAMPKTMMLVADKGTTLKNSFVNTPLCCPSRSTLLTGLYQHNTHVWNNSIEGNCNSVEWQHKHEPHTFVQSFSDAGYRTFYAGKYLNQYGSHKAGGLQHVPKGWQWWAGLKGNSRYYNYTLSVNGSAKHFPSMYLTDHIHDLALEFMRSLAVDSSPFLMVLAPPAPHAPYTPAPKYAHHYINESVPRTPNFNPPYVQNKHWMIRMPPNPLPHDVITKIDDFWRRRWCTLLSVDDMVASIIHTLRQLALLQNTFVLVTSDNGYHLGHYGLPWDKRQPYDCDIQVPFFVRGPGVKRQVLGNAVMTADIAPTLLDMAGLSIPFHMDGRSFYHALLSRRKKNQKRAFLIEYSGEGGKSVSSQCPWYGDSGVANCELEAACKCQDSKNNTYTCVRVIGPHQNSAFCKFHDKEEFVEAYNMRTDPYQMRNIARQLKKKELRKYLIILKKLQNCSGISCSIF